MKWNQAHYHLKFNYLRNGINHTGGPDEIVALLDDTKPQPWRIPPPRNALPRTVGKTDPDEDKPGRDDGIVAYAAQGGRVLLNEKKRGAAKDVTNQVARNLYDLVRALFCFRVVLSKVRFDGRLNCTGLRGRVPF